MANPTNTHNPALDPDSDNPVQPGLELAQFGAGCFWGVELAFQRLPGVVKTEVGYSQGHAPDPNYKLVCSGSTNHVEVVRIHFDPNVCSYVKLLDLFWSRHDPTTLNRQGGDTGTQYRSGIYYYNETQARLAQESKEAKEAELKGKKIVTEILAAKRFYRAEEYHQQYLEKGGRSGNKQSASKDCNDPIRKAYLRIELKVLTPGINGHGDRLICNSFEKGILVILRGNSALGPPINGRRDTNMLIREALSLVCLLPVEHS